MDARKFLSFVVPQTAEGFRGAFFGLFLTMVVGQIGNALGIVVLIAFATGLIARPNVQKLFENDREKHSSNRFDQQFFKRN